VKALQQYTNPRAKRWCNNPKNKITKKNRDFESESKSGLVSELEYQLELES
jgi:hypothetical protein